MVYRRPGWVPSVPGSASDHGGFIELCEVGRACRGMSPIEMVGLASQVEWYPNTVRVPLVKEWMLIEEDQ